MFSSGTPVRMLTAIFYLGPFIQGYPHIHNNQILELTLCSTYKYEGLGIHGAFIICFFASLLLDEQLRYLVMS